MAEAAARQQKTENAGPALTMASCAWSAAKARPRFTPARTCRARISSGQQVRSRCPPPQRWRRTGTSSCGTASARASICTAARSPTWRKRSSRTPTSCARSPTGVAGTTRKMEPAEGAFRGRQGHGHRYEVSIGPSRDALAGQEHEGRAGCGPRRSRSTWISCTCCYVTHGRSKTTCRNSLDPRRSVGGSAQAATVPGSCK